MTVVNSIAKYQAAVTRWALANRETYTNEVLELIVNPDIRDEELWDTFEAPIDWRVEEDMLELTVEERSSPKWIADCSAFFAAAKEQAFLQLLPTMPTEVYTAMLNAIDVGLAASREDLKKAAAQGVSKLLHDDELAKLQSGERDADR
jgi:hypothetical protein